MKYKFLLLLNCLFCCISNQDIQAKIALKSSSRSLNADYVIVGVGTAGAVLAKELTDDHKTSVVALHIGENLTEDPLIKFTDTAIITVLDATIGFPYYQNGESIPQINDDNRQLLWAMALPEGGASSINAGAYCRGTNQVYSQWEAIAGPKWSVNRILDLYKRLETYHGQTTNPDTRGYHGPLSIRQVAQPSQVSQTFNQAIINATGFPFVLDYNDPNTPIGSSSQLQYTQSPDGILRVSSATAFLNEDVMTPDGFGVHGRKLRVLFESPALRVIWKCKKAIGVEYLSDGETKKVYAKKGVIVCAGVRSSAFLMHSGVGPKNLLKSLDIPVVFDNPNVGQGLADQPGCRTIFSSDPADTPLLDGDSGVFSQISWLPVPGGDPTVRQLRIATVNPLPGITFALFDLCQPLSRGSITINSKNPLDPFVIDLGTFNNPSDLETFQKGFQVYYSAINSAIQLLNPDYQLIYPDPAILNDVNALTDFIKNSVGCNQHFESHCRMAPQNQGGVVDSSGFVYGVENLIVADDSIVPLCMDGSPMASAYLIGANIAEQLIERDNQPKHHRCRHRSSSSSRSH